LDFAEAFYACIYDVGEVFKGFCGDFGDDVVDSVDLEGFFYFLAGSKLYKELVN
jgi:hypothetical protein